VQNLASAAYLDNIEYNIRRRYPRKGFIEEEKIIINRIRKSKTGEQMWDMGEILRYGKRLRPIDIAPSSKGESA
jgi:hypothetical protein